MKPERKHFIPRTSLALGLFASAVGLSACTTGASQAELVASTVSSDCAVSTPEVVLQKGDTRTIVVDGSTYRMTNIGRSIVRQDWPSSRFASVYLGDVLLAGQSRDSQHNVYNDEFYAGSNVSSSKHDMLYRVAAQRHKDLATGIITETRIDVSVTTDSRQSDAVMLHLSAECKDLEFVPITNQ